MSMGEIGRTLVYYAVVSSAAACAATVSTIPFTGVAATVATVDGVIVAGWATSIALDAVSARRKGGRS